MSLKDILDDGLDLKESIEKIAKETVKDIGKNANVKNIDAGKIANAFKAMLLKKLSSIGKDISSSIKDYNQIIQEMGGFTEILKTAWNLEEKDVDILTFEMIISWTKQNFNQREYSGACLIRNKSKTEYNLFFLDKNDNPLLDGSAKHIIFYSKKIDDDLKMQLSDKDMLLIK